MYAPTLLAGDRWCPTRVRSFSGCVTAFFLDKHTNLTTPAASAEKLALMSLYYQDHRTLRWWHPVRSKKRVTAIVSRVLRTTRSTTSSSWVTRHAGWHQLVGLRSGSIGKRWGTARIRVRARRSYDAVRVHVASCKSLANFGSSRASFVRGRRLRARRLYELPRVARLCGEPRCARRHRSRRLARPARRGIRPSGAYSQKPRSASRERGRLARRSACVRRLGGRFGSAARSIVLLQQRRRGSIDVCLATLRPGG